MPLSVLLEAVLFYKATPQKKSVLQKLFMADDVVWHEALNELKQRLENGATRLVETESELLITTAPELSELIESLRKEELKGDIGKAGAETLAIVLYKEPVSRAEIDRIRGVNSAFILRNLMVKGLVKREAVGNSFQFLSTPELLQYLGVTDKINLPQYSEFVTALETFSHAETT
jgi:segregation and condensation protein B